MPAWRLLLAVALLSAGPGLALAALAMEGFAPWPPVLAGLGLVFAASLLIALLWAHDLRILAAALRAAAADHPPVSSRLRGDTPVLPGAAPLLQVIDRLARDRAAQEGRIGQMRRADAAVVERLPDPLIVLSGGRTPLRANAAARAAFGTDIAAVLRHPDLRAAIARAYAQGNVQTASVALAAPVDRILDATIVPMDPPLADGGAALVILADRTRERALEQMRADFVANASHELRTPLASLIGFVETLRGPAADDPPAQRRFLGIMAEQGARMNRLIDDLLSLSRIELNEHMPPTDAVALPPLLARVAAGMEPRLREAGARLEMDIAPGLPAITGDADQLAQVFQNLMDNAMKYGAEHGTTRTRAAPAPPNATWPARPGIVVSVTDEGPGIAPEHLPRLTERFYRVDKGRSRAVGGTGLGLAIVKHIVNRHRGVLRIESEIGKGTTISVWLPQAAPPPG
jgi:two-component system, OmpR family, phosphate regulon sensor histidine kinase PhoR